MVGTFLPPDLKDKPKVSEIYDGLAEKIRDKLIGYSLACTYQEKEDASPKPRSLDSKEAIKAFLTAKDFYNYRNFQLDKSNTQPPPASNDDLTLDSLFAYSRLTLKNRHTILLAMDVPVCPYCNMNYTSDYERNGEHRTTADLDHFYIKSKYPEYALCLYNFVPSCPVCNSRLKLDKSMTRETHVFPHEESFTGKARFEISNLCALYCKGPGRARADLDLVIQAPTDQEQKRVKASEQVFELRSRYQAARSEAEELLEKAITYNDTYAAELSKLTPGVADVKQLVFGAELTEREAARKSLGKLKADLLKQFGVY